jgi:aminoglycoside phosphotransferase (APT) family kinase protein
MKDAHLKKYRVAIARNFPQLTITNMEYLGEGWNSLACRVNEDLIFRFPKRAEVEQSLLTETRLLPQLAPHLPAAIPDFSYIASARTKNQPYIFVGYPLIPGTPLQDCPEEVLKADWWRPALAKFLVALHSFPLEKAAASEVPNKLFPNSPVNDWRSSFQHFYRETEEMVFPLLKQEQQHKIRRRFNEFLNDERNFDFSPALIHADLNEEHVLLDLERQELSGVIDFGDCCIGDPAYDVWGSLLPFYDRPREAGWENRRQFYLRLPALNSIIFGREFGDPLLVEWGLNGLDRFWFSDEPLLDWSFYS